MTKEQVASVSDLRSALILPQYAIALYITGRDDGINPNVGYFFYGEEQQPLFVADIEQTGFPLDSLEAAVEVLKRLSIRPGQAYKREFYFYTAGQLQWATSFECEILSYVLMDWDGPQREKARKTLAAGLIKC